MRASYEVSCVRTVAAVHAENSLFDPGHLVPTPGAFSSPLHPAEPSQDPHAYATNVN